MNILDFGAVGDGINDDHSAIQNVLDNHDGTVRIPQGVYKIGSTLRISSGTRLDVHPEARLFLADGAGRDSQSFLITNKNHAEGDRDIHIKGGIWDGNCLGNPRGLDKPGSYTGAILNLINVTDFSLKQMTFRDAEAYFTRFSEVRNFEITDILFQSFTLRNNQDGIHIAGNSENGLIRNIVGVGEATNDDLVTISADDAISRAQNLDLACGAIRNIRIEDLQAESCHTFVRLLSVHHPISDVAITNVKGGCRCMALNMDGCRECRVLLFDPDDPRYQNGVGDISNVQIANFKVHKSSEVDNTPLINIRSNLNDFTIEQFDRNAELDLNPSAPTVSFSDCRPTRIQLDGLSSEQINTLQLSPKAQLNGNQLQLSQKAVMRLIEGGFEAMSISDAEQNA